MENIWEGNVMCDKPALSDNIKRPLLHYLRRTPKCRQPSLSMIDRYNILRGPAGVPRCKWLTLNFVCAPYSKTRFLLERHDIMQHQETPANVKKQQNGLNPFLTSKFVRRSFCACEQTVVRLKRERLICETSSNVNTFFVFFLRCVEIYLYYPF